MSLVNLKPILCAHTPPFALCAFLIYFPYFFFSPSELFPISLKYTSLEHLLYGLLPVGLIVFATYLGGLLGRSSVTSQPSFHLRQVHPLVRAFLWLLLAFSMMVQVIQVLLASIGYSSGGFLEARESALFEGIGVAIRLDIFILPLLSGCARNRRIFRYTALLIALLHILRAIFFSERTAIVELGCIAWVTIPILGIFTLSIRHVAFVAAFFLVLFSLILSMRLDQQSEVGGGFDSSSTTLTGSLVAYYADTMNKYYLILGNDFRYPGLYILEPIYALVGGSDLTSMFTDLLKYLESSTGSVSSVLNNPGGLAQDVSDFGTYGLAFVFLKFLIFSFCWSMRYRSFLYLAISPFVLLSVLEYPRFNYLYMPFGFILFVTALLAGFALDVTSRKESFSS
jgi:hypothetical protein